MSDFPLVFLGTTDIILLTLSVCEFVMDQKQDQPGSGIKPITFEHEVLENMFFNIEKLLRFDKINLYSINYEAIDYTELDDAENNAETSQLFMKNNEKLYKAIGNKESAVYCIWVDSEIKYVGSSDEPWNRIRQHLFRPGKKTKSCIANVKPAVEGKKTIEITFAKIKPSYMKTAVEGWLIEKIGKENLWNERSV